MKKNWFSLFFAACLLTGLIFTSHAIASGNSVYIAQSSAGAGTGLGSCSNAQAYTAFNNAGNWTTGTPSGFQIGPGTTVYVCTNLTSNATQCGPLLTFQGSGSSGNPVVLELMSGVVISCPQAAELIELNGKNDTQVTGPTVCGETAYATVTACGATLENTLSGSAGQACPGGTCTLTLSDNSGVGSTMIADTSANGCQNCQVTYLNIGPVYVRSNTSNAEGMTSSGIIFVHNSPKAVEVNGNVFTWAGKHILFAYDEPSGTQNGFNITNNNFTNQCWAIGMGGDVAGAAWSGIEIIGNEISEWAGYPFDNDNSSDNVCHANGTMLFNGDGGTIFSPASEMGDSSSNIADNYVHGDLTDGDPTSSPSGLISCQDNCGPINVYNNVIISTCVNPCGGGNIYFNGVGGGGQKLYHNTLVCNTLVSAIVVTANSQAGWGPIDDRDNVISGCGVVAEMRQNNASTAFSSETYNDGYLGSGYSGYVVSNTANSGNFISLATWKAAPYSQAANDIQTNPNLGANWQPNAGSPVYGAGVVISGQTLDILGNAWGGSPAMGAFAGTATKPIGLVISSASPPSGTVGTAYSFTFTASGGTSPYSWSINPTIPGLSLAATTGVLSGTPTESGATSSTVTATDSSSPKLSATQNVSIVINPASVAPPPPTVESTLTCRVSTTRRDTSTFTITCTAGPFSGGTLTWTGNGDTPATVTIPTP